MIIDILSFLQPACLKADALLDLPTGVDRLFVANLAAADVEHGGDDLDEPTANVAVLEFAMKHAFVSPLYWLRVGQFDSNLHAVAGAMASEPFVGAVLAPHWHGFRIDDVTVDPSFELLGRIQRPALVLASPSELARPAHVYAIARRHPRVPVVLCGGASNTHLREALDVLQIAIEREDANLYLDTSGAAVGDIVSLIRKIGPERVLFSSGGRLGEPADEPGTHEWITELEQAIPAAQFVRVMSGNATKLFTLNPEPAPVRH